MTRCSCSPINKRSARNPNTSFFYKILSSLKQLQSMQKFCNGATVEDIVTFMETKYDLSGDVHSQIENSLCIAEESRFVLRKKNCYSLVSPAATLQLIPAPCVKAKLERIQKVFNSKWCEKDDSADKCRVQRQQTCQPPPRPKRPRSPRPRDNSCRPRTRSWRKRRIKFKCKSRTMPRTKRKAAGQPRSKSVCGYRTRSRTKRRAKVLPMCSTSTFSNCGNNRSPDMDSDSSSCCC